MRGVEAAMYLWRQVSKGGIVSESLRALGDRVSPPDRTLAASLAYALVRRLSLWEHLRERFLLPRPEKFSKPVRAAVLTGAAGLTELEKFAPAVLISSLIEWTKARDPRGARVVNAVLRRVLEEGPAELARLRNDGRLDSLCLLSGVPLWVGERWRRDYGADEGRRLVEQNAGGSSLSLRLSPGAPRDLPQRLEEAGQIVAESPLPEGLRLADTALPSALPGYGEGWFAPQSESSILVGTEAADFEGTRLLDMCAGRGVKTGQIAQLRPDIAVEGWDLSKGRVAAGVREMERLKLSGRVVMRTGSALELEPLAAPDAILVDAPCSGSGTWRRHPEGKWRLSPESLTELAELQYRLLCRAFSLVKKGGKVVYSTCSLLAAENEEVVEKALRAFPEISERPLSADFGGIDRGRGRVLTPENPWTDGFYLAAFSK
ncbi:MULTISPECIES: RsmB/NOP family class I SAM-dependent RNA methyltransferase [unclassified Pyramidobacter]|uniref:RsmB/NOP family class I SAM-dependent RNA methyltransferase n=1 Tax=unclassified Pyramidobacter TaxID=2632171 RepID=UPI001315A47D|nr:RsmB/NOP family class I SAM-dependent RNA methyltransferase [Pyramidobacter sp. CG50-2]